MSSILFFLALFLSTAFAQQPNFPGILLDVPVLPSPVNANHKAQLLYELHITNIEKSGLELMRIDVFADQISKTPLVSYDSAHLENWLKRPGLADDLPNKRLIGAGYRAVVFFNVAVELTALPHGLYHRLFFKEENGREVSVESERVVVQPESAIVLNAPLRGAGWVALNGLGAPSHHRLSFLPRGGRAVVPQRYAIDWVRLGAEGKLSHDNAGEKKNHYSYGAEALAVADATVEKMREGLPEMTPFANNLEPVPFENTTGNYVMLNLGQGRFALYAHLQPGSIRVKEGQHVRAGQVLGLVGSSGSSPIPHLHFHLVDASHPLLADGLPYVFNSFVVQGNVGSIDSLIEGRGITRQPVSKPDKRSKELPANLDVVSFP